MAKRKRDSEDDPPDAGGRAPPEAGGRIIRGRMNVDEEANSHSVINNDETVRGGNRHCASCEKYFPSAEAYRNHYLLKKTDVNSRLLPAKEFSKYRHQLLCSKSDCCFSTSSKQSYKIHLRTHNIPWPKDLLIIDIGSQDDFLTAYQCRICCRVMGTENGLRIHQRSCSGKYIYSCTYCNAAFNSRDAYINHLNEKHSPATDFEVTGIFIGREKKVNGSHRKKRISTTERTMAILTPGITAVSEVFTENMISAIRRLVEWEIAAHNRVSAKLVCNAIITKDEGHEVLTKKFTAASRSVNVSQSRQISNVINVGLESVTKAIASLHAEPSGFKIQEITSLTLVTTPLPDFRGGCGNDLLRTHGRRERRGLAIITGEAGENHTLCFRDSILYGLYARESFSQIRSSIECESEQCNRTQCSCYLQAEKIFKEAATKSTFWDKYEARDDWTGVRYPAGVEDLELFSKNNPSIMITAYQIQGEKMTILWRPQRTESHKHFIHIAWSQHLNMSNLELESHWYPIENLSRFTQKIYSNSRQEEETCVRCLRTLSLSKDKTKYGQDLHQFDHKESARDNKFGLIRYRDVYCDVPPPENLRLTNKQKRHEMECSQFHKILQTEDASLSYVTPPEDLFFQFGKYSNLVNHRFTGYWDTETFVTPLQHLCVKCEINYDASSSASQRERIYHSCLESSHIKQKTAKCGACSSRFRRLLLDHVCLCESVEKIMGNCENCHKRIEDEFGICHHQKTKQVKKLDCSGYAFVIKDNYTEEIVWDRSYVQETPEMIQPIRHFLNTLSGHIIPNILAPALEIFEPMDLTELEEESFQSAQTCWACCKPFAELRDPGRDKMRDHDHISGEFRGAACRSCNGKLMIKREMTILAHNLSGFDSHLLMRNLVGFDAYHTIPRSKEQLVGISMVKRECGEIFGPEGRDNEVDGACRVQEADTYQDFNVEKKRTDFTVLFRDSKSFLSGSLDRCVELLKKSNHGFEYLKKSPICHTDGKFDSEKFNLLLRKGVYPYELMVGYEDFQRTELPTKEDFKSSLGVGREITDEDYEHGRRVWQKFKIRNMAEYTHLYVLLDTYLLLEAWEPICEETHAEYGIWPCHYFTLPSLALDCCLYKLQRKNREERIELLRDEHMIQFVNQSKRGGLTSVLGDRLAFSRYGSQVVKECLDNMKDDLNEVTIHQLKQALDVTISELKPDEDYYLLYLDANNLYGLSQIQKLPLKNFRWADEDDLEILSAFFAARNRGEKISWEHKDENGEYIFDPDEGYFIMADLEIPEDKLQLLENFPPAPHKVVADDLSEFSQQLLEEAGEKHKPGEKLCVTLLPKLGYVTHYKLLDLYSEIGVKVTNITKALKFTQDDFLKDWVEVNTAGRKRAAGEGNEVRKAFYKMIVNSVFGKLGENLVLQHDLSIVFDEETFQKEMLNPFYKDHSIIDDDIILIEKYKESIQLNRPVQISAAILELAKAEMYRYWYKVLQPTFGERISALYTDTDSLVLKLRSDNIERDLGYLNSGLDTSNFPESHPLYTKSKQSELGFFKSEVGTNEISVFAGIRPKCYTMSVEEVQPNGEIVQSVDNKLKGVDRSVVRKMNLENYLRTIMLNQGQSARSTKLSSKKHTIYQEEISKRALSNFDDKVKILLCGIHTRKYGAPNYSDHCNCAFSNVFK